MLNGSKQSEGGVPGIYNLNYVPAEEKSRTSTWNISQGRKKLVGGTLVKEESSTLLLFV